jgi:hypothetical protein
LKFDLVAKLAECADHSESADSLGLFGHRRASLLISDAFIQNHPDQLTDAMRNRPDGFVVAETRNETTGDDLEDASFRFDGSIGSLIEKATHVPIPLRRARAVIYSRALFLSRACLCSAQTSAEIMRHSFPMNIRDELTADVLISD